MHSSSVRTFSRLHVPVFFGENSNIACVVESIAATTAAVSASAYKSENALGKIIPGCRILPTAGSSILSLSEPRPSRLCCSPPGTTSAAAVRCHMRFGVTGYRSFGDCVGMASVNILWLCSAGLARHIVRSVSSSSEQRSEVGGRRHQVMW